MRESEEMRQLAKLRHRWEGNTKMDLNKSMDRYNLALHRDRGLALVNMAVGFFFF